MNNTPHDQSDAHPQPSVSDPRLQVHIAGITLPNPVMPASGTFEFGHVHNRLMNPARLGAIVNKTIFLKERPGNPPPRIIETPCGMLNAIGIPSKGTDAFISDTLPRLKTFRVPLIISIAGGTIEEFCEVARRIEASGQADILELNLSCPNLSQGLEWSQDEKALAAVVTAVKQTVDLPLVAKLSPSVRDIARMGKVAEEAGADALSLINSYKGMVINIHNRRPFLGNLTGGMSGPAIHPLAVYAVYSVYTATTLPIIGMGGISTWQEALEMMMAGATAVAVGMYNFINPRAMIDIIEKLSDYCTDAGLDSIKEIIGCAHEEK